MEVVSKEGWCPVVTHAVILLSVVMGVVALIKILTSEKQAAVPETETRVAENGKSTAAAAAVAVGLEPAVIAAVSFVAVAMVVVVTEAGTAAKAAKAAKAAAAVPAGEAVEAPR